MGGRPAWAGRAVGRPSCIGVVGGRSGIAGSAVAPPATPGATGGPPAPSDELAPAGGAPGTGGAVAVAGAMVPVRMAVTSVAGVGRSPGATDIAAATHGANHPGRPARSTSPRMIRWDTTSGALPPTTGWPSAA